MLRTLCLGCAVILLPTVCSAARGGVPAGLWLTPRKDPRNQARADVSGRMREAPREVWHMPTGGTVSYAHEVDVSGDPAILIQAGSNLELVRSPGGPVWRQGTLGVGLVMRVDDFDGDGRNEVLVRTDVRTLVLLDVATGEKLWAWQSAPSTQVISRAFLRTPTGIRLICFPNYSLDGTCFDFSGDRREPKLLWQRNYAGKYGAGYGPSIVLKDMTGNGKLDIVLSGKVPSVSQAVINVDNGDILFEARHDLGGWGRPYGLLTVRDLDADGLPDVVMVSCQVEEYACVARNVDGTGLSKIWGRFVEKDWPKDLKELRPQVTSVADLRGNGRSELVVGLWDGATWRTLLIDPMTGFDAQRGALEGLYFWGCHDLTGDKRPELVVSTESERLPARVSTLVALDGETLEPVAELADAAAFTSSDSDVPADTFFMAIRRNPVFIRASDGTGGVLVHRYRGEAEIGTFLWGGRPGVPIVARQVAGPGFDRVDLHDGKVLLSGGGRIQRFGEGMRPVGEELTVNGRLCRPLVWAVGEKRQLVVDTANGIVGGVPVPGEHGKLRDAWRVPGNEAFLQVDRAGMSRLATIGGAATNGPSAAIHTAPIGGGREPVHVRLPHPVYSRAGLVPYGDAEFRLLACLQTGVHTLALATYDADGKLLWQDTGWGAYPKLPAAADIDGDGAFEVLADDHGKFRIYDGTGAVVASHGGWPPAYCVPIVAPFRPDGGLGILRASGINGVDLLDTGAKRVWLTRANIWRYYNDLAAVGDVAGTGALSLGTLAEDGTFECIDTGSGKVRWSVGLGAKPSNTSVVAGDIDGDSRDEFLVGLPDGRLVCIEESQAQGRILWEKELSAAVANPIVADVDGDGFAEIIVSTSDGEVRVLEE